MLLTLNKKYQRCHGMVAGPLVMVVAVLGCDNIVGPGSLPAAEDRGDENRGPTPPAYQRPSFECRSDGPQTGATARVWRLTAAQHRATIKETFSRFRLNPRTLEPPSYQAPFTDTNPADRFSTYVA